jgi:hypothetical protein
MKKALLTAVAVLFSTLVVNAASVNWNTGNMTALPSYSTEWLGQSVAFFLAPSGEHDNSALIASLSNGGALDTSSADLIKAIAGAPFNAASGTGATATFNPGDIAYGYAVVYNASGTQFALSTVRSATFSGVGNTTMNLGGAANFTVYNVVPEPTSMALLAMGIAAVGLRRRFRK